LVLIFTVRDNFALYFFIFRNIYPRVYEVPRNDDKETIIFVRWQMFYSQQVYIYGKKPNTKYFSPNIYIFQYLILMNKKRFAFFSEQEVFTR